MYVAMDPRESLQATCDERGPTSLVTRAETMAVVAMEVLVEENEVSPVGPIRICAHIAVARTPPVRSGHKNPHETSRELLCDLPEIEEPLGARRTLHLQIAAVEVVVPLQRLDDEPVRREPDRAAPVRVAAEEACGRFTRGVLDDRSLVDKGALLVDARQRTHAERG